MSITIYATIEIVLAEDDEFEFDAVDEGFEVEFMYDEDGVLCYYDEELDELVECDDVDYDDAGYAYYFDVELEAWLYFDDEVNEWVEFDFIA